MERLEVRGGYIYTRANRETKNGEKYLQLKKREAEEVKWEINM